MHLSDVFFSSLPCYSFSILFVGVSLFIPECWGDPAQFSNYLPSLFISYFFMISFSLVIHSSFSNLQPDVLQSLTTKKLTAKYLLKLLLNELNISNTQLYFPVLMNSRLPHLGIHHVSNCSDLEVILDSFYFHYHPEPCSYVLKYHLSGCIKLDHLSSFLPLAHKHKPPSSLGSTSVTTLVVCLLLILSSLHVAIRVIF